MSLYRSAMSGAKLMRYGDIVHVVFADRSAMLAWSADFLSASRWAEGQPSKGMMPVDRGVFLARLELVVPELTATGMPAKGSASSQLKLKAAAKAVGLPVVLFAFPREQAEANAPEVKAAEAEMPVPAAATPEQPAAPAPGPASDPEPLTPQQLADRMGMSFLGRQSERYQSYLAEWQRGRR